MQYLRALVSIAATCASIAGLASAQSAAKDTEWPSYNADVHGTRYRPLDQINASNFNKLEVAWRFKTDSIGNRPEYKLEGTPIRIDFTEKENPFTAQMRHETDLSLFRQFHVGLGEERFFEFRADSFNLFNNVVFNTPDASISDTTFGQVRSQQNQPRQLQVALKFYY